MGAPRLLNGLALILWLQVVSSRPTADATMQKPGIRSRETLQAPLGATRSTPHTCFDIRDPWDLLSETHHPKEAFWTGKAPHGPLDSLPARLFPSLARSRPKRHARDRPEEQGCHLRSMLVRVKDLGLGYDSEETILFKYCSGRCPKARSNHDLTLSLLLQKSEIPAPGEPCCRPSHYENVAFLDDSHQWHEVEQLSASSCSCMG